MSISESALTGPFNTVTLRSATRSPWRKSYPAFRLWSSPWAFAFGLFLSGGVILGCVIETLVNPPPADRPYALLLGTCLIVSFAPIVLGFAVMVGMIMRRLAARLTAMRLRRRTYTLVLVTLVLSVPAINCMRAWLDHAPGPRDAIFASIFALTLPLLLLLTADWLRHKAGFLRRWRGGPCEGPSLARA